MTTRRQAREQRRFRLAANDNETVVTDVAGHAMTRNDNETVVTDVADVEGHRLATNDAETTVRDRPAGARPDRKEH
jgi:hypothetical protein